MKDRDLEPLAPELDVLLQTERQRPGFSAAAQSRMLARLEASMVAMPAPRRWWQRRGPFGVATFVLGLLVGSAAAGLWARPSSAPLTLPSIDPQPDTRARAQGAIIPTVAADPEPIRAPQPTPIAGLDERDRDLAAERALLETARTSVARGQSAATLEALARHAQRFPKGRLIEEREGLWVQALVQAGRYVEARGRAAHFRQRFPTSLLLPTVDAALKSIP